MVPEIRFTLGQDWVKQFMSGMRLLHFLQQQDVTIAPRIPVDPNVLVQVLQEIVEGSYQSDKYFSVGEKPLLELISQPPVVEPSKVYTLLGLNAETARSRFISTQTGGIAFEDPFWAIFAAQAVAEKLKLALPLAKNNMDLWQNAQELAMAIRQHKYKPEKFFGAISDFYPLGSPPRFSLITIESNQLEALRTRSMQSFMRPPRFFELFQLP